MMTQLVSVIGLTRVMRGGSHRSIRSHCMAFDATPGPPATLLPRSLDKLSAYKVVLAGSITDQQLRTIRNLHTVRGSKVESLLRFYKAKNHFYANVSVACADTSGYSDRRVADTLFNFNDSAASDVVEHVDEDQSRVGVKNDLKVLDSTKDECEMIERSVVFVNDMGARPNAGSSIYELPTPTSSGERRFVVQHSSSISRDDDGCIYAKMFPHLFPYGRGHPGEEREIPVSQEACIKYYSMLSSRQFAQDETFMLVAFDRLSTQKMFMQISLTCKRHPGLFHGYEAITHDQLSGALRRNELRLQGRLPFDTFNRSTAEQFLRTVELGTGSLWGSNLERQRCRALFVTLTPNVDNSFALAQYAGCTSVDTMFDCLESRIPTKVQLRKATLNNDVASARLFMRYIDAFVEDVLAVDKKTGASKSYPGLLGPVRAYYGMVETQGGGTLHAHFIIWLRNCPRNSDEFERLMASDATRVPLVESIEAFSSSIVTNTLPLSVKSHHCQMCRSSYATLESIPIPSVAYADPKTNGRLKPPLLVKCSHCEIELSSQQVLRQVLMENRPATWPPLFDKMTPQQINQRAAIEQSCRYNFAHAVRVIKLREYLQECYDDVAVSPNADKPRARSITLPDRSDIRDDPLMRLVEILPAMENERHLTKRHFDFMVSALAVLLNEHWWTHTGSCFKTSRVTSAAGVCRYSFPRKRVLATRFDTRGVQICREPAHEYINGFNPVMMAAFKSNHDIQVLLGEKDVIERIYYCCKYVTKYQNQVDSVAAVALAAFRRREEREQIETTKNGVNFDGVTKSRKRVASMAFNLSNRQEMAGPLAALYILRGECAYSSTRCEKLPLYSILAQLSGRGDYNCDLVDVSDEGEPAYRPVGAMDDYVYRPSKQDEINLYQFCMKHFRRKRTKATNNDVLFHSDHPLFKTSCLGIRSRDLVPVVLGPRMPYVNEDSPDEAKVLRARIALILFKPFRTLQDLVLSAAPTETDWIQVYTLWEKQRGPFEKTIMANMDDYFLGREKAADQRCWEATEETAQSDSDEDFDDTAAVHSFTDAIFADDGNTIDIYESNDDTVGDGDPADTLTLNPAYYPAIPEASKHAKNSIQSIAASGMLCNSASHTAATFARLHGFRMHGGPTSRFPQPAFLKQWVKDSSTDATLVQPNSQGQLMPRETKVVELIHDALNPKHMVWYPIASASVDRAHFPTLCTVSKEFTLNKLQHAAFCKIGKVLLTRWLRDEPSAADPGGGYQGPDYENELTQDQLLFFLGGAGGTGKSRVIDAVTKFCSSWRRSTCILKTALTGKAATLIHGRTLASFMLSLERANSSDFVGVDILVIDEVSMLTKSNWLKLDKLLRRYKRVPGVPFGGIHVVLVGDFLQLPPVGADPIYVDPRDKVHYSTTDIEGFYLWRRFESAIVLEESVRFRNDPEWGAGCAAARLGQWSQSFIDMINSRLVASTTSGNWSAETVFVTPDNATRAAINHEFVIETAKRLAPGNYPIRLVANFKGTLSHLSRHDVEHVMRLPDTRFRRMAPFLDLIPGMPIQVTQNVRPTKGAANGTLGFLEHVEFHRDTRFRLIRDTNAGIVVQVPSKPPLYAIIRIDRGPHAVPIDHQTDPHLFPVFFDAQAYSKSSIPLPKSVTGEKRYLSVQLQQLPIASAVGSTIYKVQGETLQSMVVVDWKSPVALVNKPQQTYLLVSRVVFRYAFATIKPFTTQLAHWSRPPPAALREEARLQQLSAFSLQSVQQYISI
jgi:hypothetical protein